MVKIAECIIGNKLKLHFVLFPFFLLMIPRQAILIPILLLIPVFSLLVFVVKGRYRISKRNTYLVFVLLLVNFVVVLFNETAMQNYFIGLSTHGFIFLLLIRNKLHVKESYIDAWLFGVLLLAFYQAFLGVIQLFSYGFPVNMPYRDFTEDFFQGSFGPGGNRLAANLIVIAIMIYFYRIDCGLRQNNIWMYFLILMLVASSSNMSIFVMIVSFLIVNTPYFKRAINEKTVQKRNRFGSVFLLRKNTLTILIACSVIITGLAFVGGEYIYSTYYKWVYQLDFDQNARIMGSINTITSLPSAAPYQPFFGIGLGGYSSWAQLLQSEDYLRMNVLGKHISIDLSWFMSQSDLSYDNVLKYLSAGFFRAETQSILNQPFYSWHSIYAEQGGLGILILLLLIVPKIRLLKLQYEDSVKRKLFKKVLAFNCVFLFVNGFLDNYFEYVWMTVPFLTGLLLLERRSIRISR